MSANIKTPIELPGYCFVEILYSGSQTVVWRGIRLADERPVAIKLLQQDYPTFNELLQFRNQYIVARHLDIAGIIRPYSLESYRNGYALVMEDFGGTSLRDYAQQHPLSVARVLNIAVQVADILNDLHANCVIHKDIKPANLLIHPVTHQVKLIDFSISSLLPKETQEIQNPNGLEGTLAYIAPEQTGRMNRGIDYRSDFYSLGITLYELLSGQLPFPSNDAMELVHCHIAKQPPSLTELKIPEPIALIISKSIAKNAEDRYQSALGLKYDLENCLTQLEKTGTIEPFEIGTRDLCDPRSGSLWARFTIPEKLYGRHSEVQTLLEAFERVSQGTSELMLVAGFSGIGKTAAINEVHKPITRQKGYFIKGKFDQFNRNIPLSAFVQALRDLLGQLLCESDEQLHQWKAKILEAVGESGQVLIEVIPELEYIIGQQPPVPELGGVAAQNRFNRLFQKFIEVFSAAQHPLTLFLDDLQWADSASLELMKVLMEDNRYLLMLGAYRDNEVSPVHPFILMVEALQKAQKSVTTLTLAPLAFEDTNHLVADTLHCSRELAEPLSKLVERKTRGNPFFTTQFLKALYEDGYITFERQCGHWECDIARIDVLALTDDVVEFMAMQLQKAPPQTQDVLKLAACMGNQFDLETLAVIWQQSLEKTASALWNALQEGLILPISQIYKFYMDAGQADARMSRAENVRYRFVHDRVQQAAYSLIPPDLQNSTHYRIGQLLLQQMSPQTREERIFELVNQLNRGSNSLEDLEEREQLARLNRIACHRARAATAYQAGRNYAAVGLSLLPEDAWCERYEMCLALHEFAAEFAALCGDLEAMEQFVQTIARAARSPLDRVNVGRVQIQSKVTQSQFLEAVAIGQNLLKELGVTFPESLTFQDIERAVREVEVLLGDREIEDLLDLPLVSDRKQQAIVQLAMNIMPAAHMSGLILFPFLISFATKLSIQHGNSSFAAIAYAFYGVLACNLLKNVELGVKFGRLALDLTHKLEAKTAKPEVWMLAGFFLLHRQAHLRETLPILQEGYTTALEVGNLECVGYTAHQSCLYSFLCGENLKEVEQKARAHYRELSQVNQLMAAHYCCLHLQPLLNFTNISSSPTTFSGEIIPETKIFTFLDDSQDFFGLFYFYFYKLILALFFEGIGKTKEWSMKARECLPHIAGINLEATFYFYESLLLLAEIPLQSKNADLKDLEAWQQIEQNQEQLQQFWAAYAPMNCQHKWELVEAEKYRLLGRNYEAADYYDRAIAGAKQNQYLQEEALANELAAKFYLNWNRQKIAATYLQEAYYSYARWGAKAKVHDLETRYPQLLAPILQPQRTALSSKETLSSTAFTTLSSVSSTSGSTSISAVLDLATVLKASQTLSKEIQLEKLLAALLHTVLENTGANKAVLLMSRESEWFVEATATLEHPARIESIPFVQSHEVSPPLINQVKRTLQPVVIADATLAPLLSADDYTRQQQPKSLLCTPILQQGKLVAILFLENSLTVGAFTRDRVELLNFLCAQAAISLDNARLYEQAQTYAQQLEQSQLQLIQSEKMSALGNLVAGVAHEINNPLGCIVGNVNSVEEYLSDLLGILDLYSEKFPQPGREIEEELEVVDLDYLREDIPQLIRAMKDGGDRITAIGQSLRTFSRADSDLPQPFNLHDGLDSTLLILRHRLKAQENRPAIEVTLDYGDLPEVPCFSGQLNQVFMNILANAIDALEEANTGCSYAEIEVNPNRINIRTRAEKGEVKIAIVDNGAGMSPEVKARIFDRLFTTKGVGKGTGLGLAIARQIVEEKHGGTIGVNSELGKGTKFLLTLPLVRNREE